MFPYSYYNKDDNIHKAQAYVTQDNISDGQTNLDKLKVTVFNIIVIWLKITLSAGHAITTYLRF